MIVCGVSLSIKPVLAEVLLGLPFGRCRISPFYAHKWIETVQ